MDFVRSHYGKMQRFVKCYDSLVQVPFSEDESVQLKDDAQTGIFDSPVIVLQANW